jgi:predicted PurR-regulated permease PerM
MKVTVDADTQTFVRFWLVPLGIVVAGYAIYSARTAIIIILTALFLALALNGPVSWIEKRLPGKSRVGGTALSFILVVAFLGAFATLVIPPIVQQTAKFVETVPAIVSGASEQYKGIDELVQRYQLQDQVDQGLESLKKNASGFAARVGGDIVGSLSSLGSFFVSLILTLVLGRLWGLYDDHEKVAYHQKLASRMYHVVSGYVVGQLTVAAIGAAIMGLFVFILSLIFDIPKNLAIPSAAIYFVLCLIPMFGSTIAAVLIGFLLALNAPAAGLAFIIGFIIYQQIENNVVAPTVQSRKMELTALWILLAVTIGIYVFGVAGAIISIPIAGCLKVMFDDYLAHQQMKREKAARKPIAKLVKKSKA